MANPFSIPTAVPGLYQNQGIQSRDNLNELDPEEALAAQNLNRKQQIANLLMQRGLQPIQGVQAGRFYVPPNWAQGLAQLASAGLGAGLTNKFGEDQAAIGLAAQNQRAQAVQDYIDKTQPTPAHTLPEGTEGPVNPEIPADPNAKRAAIVQALSSRIPGLQKMGALDYGQMTQAPLQINTGGATQLVSPTGQPVATIPHTVAPNTQATIEADAVRQAKELQAKTALQERELGSKASLQQQALQNQVTLHNLPTGTAILEDKTKRELYPVPSGNAWAAADVQTALALQAHEDRRAQMEQNNQHDKDSLQLRKDLGMSEQEYKKEHAALENKWHQTQAQLEREKIQIQKSAHEQGKVPPGYRTTKEGNLEAVPGGPADLKQQGMFNQDMGMLTNSSAALDRLGTTANELLNHPGLAGITGVRGKVPDIPGTDAANARALLNTLKSQVGFGVLQEMRNNSKTGGALGNVSDAEGKRLENNLAALDTSQDIEQFKSQLKNGILEYVEQSKGRLRDAFNMKHKTGEPLPLNPSGKGPTVGTVEGGYRFKGGEPGNAKNWEKVP